MNTDEHSLKTRSDRQESLSASICVHRCSSVAHVFLTGACVAWQRIRGHDAQIEAFRRAVRRGRLAHAYLFTGPSGVGKRLFAVELAKTLFCPNATPEQWQACDNCSSCQ